MKKKLLILVLVMALTVTGMAIPLTAYGAEANDAQTAGEAIAEQQDENAAAETQISQEEISAEEQAVTEEIAAEQPAARETAEEQTTAEAAEMVSAGSSEEQTAEPEDDETENSGAAEEMMMAAPAEEQDETENTVIDKAPKNVKAVSNSYNSIQVTWDAVQDVSSYIVLVSKDKKTWDEYKTCGNTLCIVRDVPTKSTRYFKVVSIYTNTANNTTVETESDVVSGNAAMKAPVASAKFGTARLSGTVSWTKVAGASGYYVEKWNASKGKYQRVKTVSGGNVTSLTVTPTPGINNTYVVYAYRPSENGMALSPVSNKVTLDLRGESTTSLKFRIARTAVYGNRTGNNSAALTWTKVAGADGYVLYRYDAAKKSYATCKVLSGGSTTKTNVWVPADKSSRFIVRAYRNQNGKKIWTPYGAYKTIPALSKSIRILNTGKSKMGCGYVWGASGPSRFDCSGFTMYVMRQHGIYLPHNAAGQYNSLRSKNVGTNWRNAKAGDLVFYSYGGAGSSHHVGIYAGNGKLLHASSSHGRVTLTSVTYTNGHIAAICRP